MAKISPFRRIEANEDAVRGGEKTAGLSHEIFSGRGGRTEARWRKSGDGFSLQ
jgi:hypothetical protein